jgi:hypothetical protein
MMFKPGDKVRLIGNVIGNLTVGNIYTVVDIKATDYEQTHDYIVTTETLEQNCFVIDDCGDFNGWYNHHFELVEEKKEIDYFEITRNCV